MQQLDPATLPAGSAAAILSRCSHARLEFLVADDGGMGLVAARWRRRTLRLGEAQSLDEHVLSYCESGGTSCTLTVDGEPTRGFQRAQAISFIPANRAVKWAMQATREFTHVDIYVPFGAIGAGPVTRNAEPVERALVNLRDPWLAGYFALLVAEVEACRRTGRTDASTFLDDTGPLLIDHLALLSRPAASRGAGRPRGEFRVSPLRPFIVARIDAHVQANLAGDIRLEQLAGLADLSVDHFVRTFREATGSTPHQYVLERRLDRACALLRNSAEPVSAIAQRCGFAGAAHFAATFRHHRGVTPSQYRQRQ